MQKKIQEMIKKMKLTHNDTEVAKCRKYLEKAKGDLEKAIELRKKDDGIS
jgi:translation elongation factor EF-Ts